MWWRLVLLVDLARVIVMAWPAADIDLGFNVNV